MQVHRPKLSSPAAATPTAEPRFLRIEPDRLRFRRGQLMFSDVRSHCVTRGKTMPALLCGAAAALAWTIGAELSASLLLGAAGLLLWVARTVRVLQVRDLERQHAVLWSPDAAVVAQAHAELQTALARWKTYAALQTALEKWREVGSPVHSDGAKHEPPLEVARSRRAEAELLVLRAGQPCAIDALAQACRNPAHYASVMLKASTPGRPILRHALHVLAHDTVAGGHHDWSDQDLVARAQRVIDVDSRAAHGIAGGIASSAAAARDFEDTVPLPTLATASVYPTAAVAPAPRAA